MHTNAALYEQDLYAWFWEQAARLREGAWHALDLEHLIEEIEDVGHSQQDKLLAICCSHLLKLWHTAQHLSHDYARAGARLAPELSGAAAPECQSLAPQSQPAPHRARGRWRMPMPSPAWEAASARSTWRRPRSLRRARGHPSRCWWLLPRGA